MPGNHLFLEKDDLATLLKQLAFWTWLVNPAYT
jgi:hypothetical protein